MRGRIEAVLAGDEQIALIHGAAHELIGEVETVAGGDGVVDLCHFDPPWAYRNHGVRGNANDEYGGCSFRRIISVIRASFHIASPDSYMVCWCTFPHIMAWGAMHEFDGAGSAWLGHEWRHLSGGAWSKEGPPGVGFHLRGNAEPWLLYAKGDPRPRSGPHRNTCRTFKRLPHSQKPAAALDMFLRMAVPSGGLVLDPYAGKSASMALACRRSGTRYLGAEISESRWRQALSHLAQREMFCLPAPTLSAALDLEVEARQKGLFGADRKGGE